MVEHTSVIAAAEDPMPECSQAEDDESKPVGHGDGITETTASTMPDCSQSIEENDSQLVGQTDNVTATTKYVMPECFQIVEEDESNFVCQGYGDTDCSQTEDESEPLDQADNCHATTEAMMPECSQIAEEDESKPEGKIIESNLMYSQEHTGPSGGNAQATELELLQAKILGLFGSQELRGRSRSPRRLSRSRTASLPQNVPQDPVGRLRSRSSSCDGSSSYSYSYSDCSAGDVPPGDLSAPVSSTTSNDVHPTSYQNEAAASAYPSFSHPGLAYPANSFPTRPAYPPHAPNYDVRYAHSPHHVPPRGYPGGSLCGPRASSSSSIWTSLHSPGDAALSATRSGGLSAIFHSSKSQRGSSKPLDSEFVKVIARHLKSEGGKLCISVIGSKFRVRKVQLEASGFLVSSRDGRGQYLVSLPVTPNERARLGLEPL